MKPIIELLAECNQFIEENPCEYGLELPVRDVKIIAEALEKQIAKKPIEASEFNNDYVFEAHICPLCEERVFTHYSHCPDCGQKIDWSVE